MKVDIAKNENGVAMIQISGEIDMMTSPLVRDALVPLFKNETSGIVIDLSDVSYMDSSGIATMIEGLQWSTKEGKKFVIAGLCDAVMDVFVLTNLKDVFEFSVDPEEAFKTLAGS